jgi:hypothetical protein
MQPINVIPTEEFLNYLRQNNLVIGSASEFVGNLEFDLQVKRANLRGKKAVTLKEILDARICKYKSKRSLNRLIEDGTIREGEWYKCAKAKQIMILTSALVRLNYL